MSRLVIEPMNLHWLYVEEPKDLCAHGGMRVSLEGEVLFETTDESGWTLSTGALHLLRSIDYDYDPSSSPSRQLIPCCGNNMIFDEELGLCANQPCPNGIDWTVRHVATEVSVRFPGDVVVKLTKKEWRHAVHDFSSKVRAFYFAQPARIISDPLDGEWHPRFVDEWNRLHEAAGD